MLFLFKSQNKKVQPLLSSVLRTYGVCAVLSYPVFAQSSSDSAQVHGFIAQGLIDVDGSDFVSDDVKVSPRLTEIGINGSYQLTSSLRLAGQAVYLDGGNRYVKGARIDYALIDWSVYNDSNWLVNAYGGRFKNIHWLYSGTRDVPHTRPSIILPQSIYFDGFRDISMGSDGLAVKASYSAENVGELDFNFSYGSSTLTTEDAQHLLGDLAQGVGEQKYVAQASIFWQPEMSQWRFGLAKLDSIFSYNSAVSDVFTDADFTFDQYIVSAMYEGELWEFSSEISNTGFKIEGFYADGFNQAKTSLGGYVQARYRFNDSLRLLARVERYYADKNDKDGKDLEDGSNGLVPSYFGFQHDITLGASYDFAGSFRADFEYHYVEGTARLTPIVFPNLELNNSKRWDIFAVQLMYWF